MPEPAWDKALIISIRGMESTKNTALQLHMELALCRIAGCTPHQSGEPSIPSFTLFLGFHEHLEQWFGREYDFKSGVKCLIQPQIFTNTKIHLWETSCALDWLTALRKKKKIQQLIPQGIKPKTKTNFPQSANHVMPPRPQSNIFLSGKMSKEGHLLLAHHKPLAHQLPHPWPLTGCNFTDFWHCREVQVHLLRWVNTRQVWRDTNNSPNAWSAGARGQQTNTGWWHCTHLADGGFRDHV